MRQVTWETLSGSRKRKVLLRPAVAATRDLRRIVKQIAGNVRLRGDRALFELTRQLDRVELDRFEVTAEEKKDALARLPEGSWAALERAASQIERFHSNCAPRAVKVEVSPGLICRREPKPISRVGLYVPGGTAPLPSTVLMLGVPSRLAGCPVRIICSPPGRDGTINPLILAAAELCGIDRVFKVGGAQAVSAMAYGTESIPKVDKIFGPGNSWVTAAKSLVASDPRGAAIDMPAGPSEVMVIADRTARPEFVAADLLSQAEHGPDSQVVVVSDDPELLERTQEEIDKQLARLPRREIATAALFGSVAILTRDLERAIDIANDYAPEHLILQVEEPEALAKRVLNAGSVFLGAWSPEAVGDYASGTNHVLPTYGYARSFGGVSVDSFVKHVTFQNLTPSALVDIGPVTATLAVLEGLDAHRYAVQVRLDAIKEGL